jgi:hypothetical protein
MCEKWTKKLIILTVLLPTNILADQEFIASSLFPGADLLAISLEEKC